MATPDRLSFGKEPHRKQHIEKDTLVSRLADPSDDFDEVLRDMSGVTYTIYYEHMELFSTITRLYSIMAGKKLPQECLGAFAKFLTEERITPITPPICTQRSKQTKNGSRVRYCFLKSKLDDAMERLNTYRASRRNGV